MPVNTRFVRLVVEAGDPALAERAAAEAFAAGATGLEECDGDAGAGTRLLLYAPAGQAAALRQALLGLGSAPEALRIGACEPVPERDWSRQWRAGLAATTISPRLAVRPEGVAFEAAPGQRVLTITPGQAFGTGGHASTRLALAWLDALASAGLGGQRVLDVGCGSGVLALAALALGARAAVACDLDPLAVEASRGNAAHAEGATGLALFRGSAGAVAPGSCDLVLANLLRREVEPILAELAAALAPGGRAVFSGLLASDRQAFGAALAARGLAVAGERREDDGGDTWLGLLTKRRGERRPGRASGPAAAAG